MSKSGIPIEVHGNPVEWVYRVDPPQFPSGYPGDGQLEKTSAFLLSVANKGTEDEQYWVSCLGVTGNIMSGDTYLTLEDAKSFPSQEFALPSIGWARRNR